MEKANVIVQIDGEKLHLEVPTESLYKLNCWTHSIESLDKITSISIIKNMMMIVTEDRDFRNGAKTTPFTKDERRINNIDAYDWNGNHLWNIGDIVGDIKMAFYGGYVTTKKDLISQGVLNDDDTEIEDLYFCIAGGFGFVIDPFNRAVIKKVSGIK